MVCVTRTCPWLRVRNVSFARRARGRTRLARRRSRARTEGGRISCRGPPHRRVGFGGDRFFVPRWFERGTRTRTRTATRPGREACMPHTRTLTRTDTKLTRTDTKHTGTDTAAKTRSRTCCVMRLRPTPIAMMMSSRKLPRGRRATARSPHLLSRTGSDGTLSYPNHLYFLVL